VEDVNRLLKMYEQTAKMMKQFKSNPKKFNRMARRMGMG
jgi:signal recognition particle GTPase